MQRLIFEYNPLWILACAGIGIAYAWLLYQRHPLWGATTNRILFLFRALVATLIAMLLIGPIIQLTTHQSEKPAIVFLVDNSLSVKETTDSVVRSRMLEMLEAQGEALRANDYEVEIRSLDGSPANDFNSGSSDLQAALRKTVGDYESRNLAALVLLSDGIYNSGASPLYLPLRTPVFTVGLGDTTERMDLALRNVAYNKIAYQGNQFPIHAEVLVNGSAGEDVKISVFRGGKLLRSAQKNSGNRALVDFDFLLDADATGIQRFDLVVDPVSRELNTKNNRTSVFIEIVEGRKKILLAAPAPHPDIKTLHATLEANANYEISVHIPGVEEAAVDALAPEKIDLAIFLNTLDAQGKNTALLQRFLKSGTGMLMTVGGKSSLRQLEANGLPFTFENLTQKDEVTPIINTTFRDFVFSDGVAGTVSAFPPVAAPFGKFTYPSEAQILFYQRIGSVNTTRPLLLSWQENDRKLAMLLGEGIWRWRMSEYAESQRTAHFDEVFSKLVQYLSTREDKRKFRSFPVQNEFSDAEPVIFESQVYNDLFEPLYGNTIQLELRNEAGEAFPYSYTTSPSGSRFRIGGLREGVYRYRASTELNGKREEVRGEFLVAAQNLESQNLTADFGLLRKLASNTGGKFYSLQESEKLNGDLTSLNAKAILRAEDSYHPLINLKAVFFLLLLLISAEWLTRKYLGSY